MFQHNPTFKRIGAIAIGATVLTFSIACFSKSERRRANHGFNSAVFGIGHLILSPIQIASGVIQGISSIPLLVSSSVHDINRAMVKSESKISLDDTYESCYGKRLNKVKSNGSTGEVFRRMRHATRHFQQVLRRYGVPDYQRYILTSVDTANRNGYTLFAVVRRPKNHMKVIDKYDGNSTRYYTHQDRMFYDAYRTDRSGHHLDEVIDWAGLPRKHIETQKAQALLITLAANAVVEGKRKSDYWEVEKRWIGGEYREITDERLREVSQSMGISTKAQ